MFCILKRYISQPSWTELASCLVRCSPGEDATNGFFVSCFVKQAVEFAEIKGTKRPNDVPNDNEDRPSKKRKKKKQTAKTSS
jgi:25S rRNA (cytosine2278-C5)-methyltransferase